MPLRPPAPAHARQRRLTGPVLQAFEKYRQAYSPFQQREGAGRSTVRSIGNVSTVGRDGGKYFARRRLAVAEMRAAYAYASNTEGVEYRAVTNKEGNLVEAYLYEMRSKSNAHYDEVEDGFTERRDNYDETTVTLQQLAEQLKTLKRDLKRAGLLG